MVDPIAPISASGVQSSVAAFEDAAQRVTLAAAPPPPDDVAPAKPLFDAQGTPLKDYPPDFVFAPGFLHADRRGIVAYPGMEITDANMKMVLTQRYVQANAVVFREMQDLYHDIVKLGQPRDSTATSD